MEDATVAVHGLATIALLKTNFDEGHDHLDMFIPFLIDAIATYTRDDFSLSDIQAHIKSQYRLRIPQDPLKTLLNRTKKKGIVRREGGRYFRERRPTGIRPIAESLRCIEGEHQNLARAFIKHAAERGLKLESEDEGLALLISFLTDNELAVLLDESLPYIRSPRDDRSRRAAARFFQDLLVANNELTGHLSRLIEGYVLQNALLLKDIQAARRLFRNLVVYLDTRCVLGALGLEGEASKLATREAIELLKSTNAHVAVFRATIEEIRGILRLCERRIGTTEGRESLRPTPLARYLLTNSYSPSNVRQAALLLEQNLKDLGIPVRDLPKRRPEYVWEEKSLTEKLRRPHESDLEPRIVHDVDCTAAILTLRGQLRPNSLDDAVAVFVTINRRLVDTIAEWMAEQREKGIPPVLHQIYLTNFAWLKKPTAITRLKIHELVALCAAALQPSRQTWERFVGHLKKLRESGEISSDESAALVASGFTDDYLCEIEDREEVEATSLTEVIDRVKATYRAQVEHDVAVAQAHARSEQESRRQMELRIKGRAGTVARVLARGTRSLLMVLVLAGSVLNLPGAFDVLAPGVEWLGWLGVIAVVVLGFLGLYKGTYITSIVSRLEAQAARSMEAWLLGRPKGSDTP